MSMLSPEERDRPTSAESLFPSPISVQSVPSDEYLAYGPGDERGSG